MTRQKQKLINGIIAVTARIQNEFPELYSRLSETPMPISSTQNGITKGDYREYLQSLTMQLKTFENRRR